MPTLPGGQPNPKYHMAFATAPVSKSSSLKMKGMVVVVHVVVVLQATKVAKVAAGEAKAKRQSFL